jgi:hypothetical protein
MRRHNDTKSILFTNNFSSYVEPSNNKRYKVTTASCTVHDVAGPDYTGNSVAN